MRYFAIVESHEGEYGVSFPDLPGCVAMGATPEAALSNAALALRDWSAANLRHEAAMSAPSSEGDVGMAHADDLARGAVLALFAVDEAGAALADASWLRP